MARTDPFHRSPGQPFDDSAKEEFAVARAQGDPIRLASQKAGINHVTGAKWAKNSALKLRVHELRKSRGAFVGVSMAWVLGSAAELYETAKGENQLKAALGCLEFITEVLKTNPDLSRLAVSNVDADQKPADIKTKFLESIHAQRALISDSERIGLPIEAEGEEVEVE